MDFSINRNKTKECVKKWIGCEDVSKFHIKDLDQLSYTFQKKPILIGGRLKELYGIRTAGKDVDLIIDKLDFDKIIQTYKDYKTVSQFGEQGLLIHVGKLIFELWLSIDKLNYDNWEKNAIETENCLLLSPFDQILMSMLASGILPEDKSKKQLNDAYLIANKLVNEIYSKEELSETYRQS